MNAINLKTRTRYRLADSILNFTDYREWSGEDVDVNGVALEIEKRPEEIIEFLLELVQSLQP